MTTIGSQVPVLIGNAGYSASKAAVNMLSKNIALDHAKDGITVNCILPGPMITEDTARMSAPPSGPGAVPERYPLGLMKPEDIVALLLPLLGPSGRFITGQSFIVDSGFFIA
ncbi:3-beta-hydroxycholanate 3-dehydrogenase (NAD(+)) 1 [Paraburkholderia rhynchosiae]|uniref:3-beta-hydroxycholanate 3-dehydrogenase (NAD(+)) 1 n=1 Tax=Paraburkholderia rhynchosiae TaxID=487049 RepID=A0A6J5CF73_9BURK|nr:3-beta-hydroxycholanate 3-dehydrogenase (NAD(+)) 1 [Paraburkholderia rhynchosiae]